MPSIENLYWILSSNLLEPVGLNCYYYHPFGTQQTLCVDQFKARNPRHQHHVIFYFDQEPLWNDNLSFYDHFVSVWSDKIVKVMANSEHSDMKKRVCRQRQMLDWYFFYHGFAALDWFRDSEFIEDDENPTKVFSSLNHLVRDHRSYRMAITAGLLSRKLETFGNISFHASKSHCEAELANPYSLLTDPQKKLIRAHLIPQHGLPMIFDVPTVKGDFSAHFGYKEYQSWQNSLVHLVNETVFYENKLHLTEKIFKPVVSLRPFVLAGAPGNLNYFRSYGFQTFDRWWDESYDMVEDPHIRSEMIVSIIEKLCQKSPAELNMLHEEMKPLLQYNKQHFFGRFRKIIVDEILDNFDTCIRIWNNGRVDGREVGQHPDLAAVKRILLR